MSSAFVFGTVGWSWAIVAQAPLVFAQKRVLNLGIFGSEWAKTTIKPHECQYPQYPQRPRPTLGKRNPLGIKVRSSLYVNTEYMNFFPATFTLPIYFIFPPMKERAGPFFKVCPELGKKQRLVWSRTGQSNDFSVLLEAGDPKPPNTRETPDMDLYTKKQRDSIWEKSPSQHYVFALLYIYSCCNMCSKIDIYRNFTQNLP